MKIPAAQIQLLFALQRLDEAVFFRLQRSAVSRRFFRLISRSADGPLYLVAAALSWLVMDEQSLLFINVLVMSFVLERPLYFVLKNGLRRRRPAQAIPGFVSLIVPSDHFSFPSGHTSGAFIVASAAALSMGGLPETSYAILVGVLYSWAVLVGMSRVMLGVHFPGDTLAGALLGSASTLLVHTWLLL